MLRAPQVAEVLILRRARQLAEPFDYLIPFELEGKVELGVLVKVPLRHSEALGVVVTVKESTNVSSLRPLIEVLDTAPRLFSYQIELLKWISAYYIESPGAVASLFFPNRFPSSLEKVVVLRSSNSPADLYRFLLENGGSVAYALLKKKFGARADRMVRQALKNDSIRVSWIVRQDISRPKMTYEIALADESQLEKLKKTSRSRRIKAFLSELQSKGTIMLEEAKEYFSLNLSELKRLETSGAFKLIEKFGEVASAIQVRDSEVELTLEQKKAVEEIKKAVKEGIFKQFLLFGPTGSGKTEVYLKAAEYALSLGREVVYLVPEISLTPQTFSRVERRFPGKTAVFHSGLSAGERLNQWLQVAQGLKSVVVGPRSALFLPFKNPGLIIVDEEHDSSFRQDTSPVYDARKVAVKLASLVGAAVVFGSATPSVEKMYEAMSRKVELLRLPSRVSGTMPEVKVIDLKGKKNLLTDELKEELTKTVEEGNRAIVFLNRRGYSVVEVCKNCGYLATCPRCSVFLRYHRDISALVCHYCGYNRALHKTCPECGSKQISLKGRGIQQVEDEISSLLRGRAKVVRFDSDVARSKGGRSRLLEFFAGQSSVLIGTQMIAKGLHLPDVTFAAIVNADVGLNLPDFRSEERTFQLIVQLIGRVGRGDKNGKVLVQSFQPERQVIRYAVCGDYFSFYKSEIEMRRINELPPFVFLIRILSSSASEEEALLNAEKVLNCLKSEIKEEASIIGPLPAPLYKLHGKFRVQILVKLKKEPEERLLSVLRKCVSSKTGKSKIQVEVEPQFVI